MDVTKSNEGSAKSVTPRDVRTRVTPQTTFHATVGGNDVPLNADHLRAIAGVLQEQSTGLSQELRYLFNKGVVGLDLPPQITVDDVRKLVPWDDDTFVWLDSRLYATVRVVSPDGISLPDASSLYGYFVPPALAEAIASLGQRLRLAGRAMVRNALTRNKAISPEDWLRTFEAIYRDFCSKLPLSNFITVVSDPVTTFRLEFKGPSFQESTCQYSEALVKIARSDDRKNEIALHVPARCLPTISRLIRNTRSGMRCSELANMVADSDESFELHKVLTALARFRGLTTEQAEIPKWDEVLPPQSALSVMHLGHAGLLIRAGQTFVAVDPWFVAGHPRYRIPPLQANQLPPLEAVFITHEHWDHINEQSLLRYPVNVPIVVPRQEPGGLLCPRFQELLRLYGFDQIVELGHWERHVLPNGLVVTAVPFIGEGTAEERSVRNCYLLERSGKRVFAHADSSIDSLGRSDLSEGVIRRLVAEHGPIDVLYATRRQELHFGFEGTSDLSPVFLGSDVRKLSAVIENCYCPASYLAGLARETLCKLLVLYSEGGAEWYSDSTNFLRRTDDEAAFAGYDYLWDSLEAIEAAVPSPVRLSLAMDVVIVDDAVKYVSTRR